MQKGVKVDNLPEAIIDPTRTQDNPYENEVQQKFYQNLKYP